MSFEHSGSALSRTASGIESSAMLLRITDQNRLNNPIDECTGKPYIIEKLMGFLLSKGLENLLKIGRYFFYKILLLLQQNLLLVLSVVVKMHRQLHTGTTL